MLKTSKQTLTSTKLSLLTIFLSPSFHAPRSSLFAASFKGSIHRAHLRETGRLEQGRRNCLFPSVCLLVLAVIPAMALHSGTCGWFQAWDPCCHSQNQLLCAPSVAPEPVPAGHWFTSKVWALVLRTTFLELLRCQHHPGSSPSQGQGQGQGQRQLCGACALQEVQAAGQTALPLGYSWPRSDLW